MHTNESRKSILMVFPTTPYPLRACGEALRYFPIVQYLSTRHDLYVIIISDFPVDSTSVRTLRQYCRTLSVIQSRDLSYSRLQKFLTQVFLLLPWTPPISSVPYGKDQIASELRRLTSGICYDVALWVTARHAVYTKVIKAQRHVVDFIDSPTLHFQRQVTGSLLRWPVVLQAYEVWKMRHWEAGLLRRMTACLYISPVDANAIPSKATTGCFPYIIPNGVSVDHYTPRVDKRMRSPSIGFLGNMGYPPNIEAVHWLYRHVFLPVRKELPDLTLYVIGRLPDDSILSLGTQEGVVVTGEVEELWPYINGVEVFVFPLWKGTGVKNKVLEAMYARRPIVASPIAVEGVEGLPGRDLLVCETQQDFVQAALHLLRSPVIRKDLGESAHRLVTDKFSWHQVLRDFESILIGRDKTDTTDSNLELQKSG